MHNVCDKTLSFLQQPRISGPDNATRRPTAMYTRAAAEVVSTGRAAYLNDRSSRWCQTLGISTSQFKRLQVVTVVLVPSMSLSDMDRSYLSGYGSSGGLRSRQGWDSSSWEERRHSRASFPKAAPIWAPTGSPPGVMCMGRLAAGHPLRL